MKYQVMCACLVTTALLSACSTAPTTSRTSSSTSTPLATAVTPALAGAADKGMPDNLKVPAGQVFAFEMAASGVQIYDCKVNKDDARKFEWVFRAPEAELFDDNSVKVGKHYAGPTWEGKDGSKVVGEVVAKYDGPDETAIPWLLLKAKSNAGTGKFAKITSIQRVATVGGKAPLKGCSDFQVGAEKRTPYKATYNFYRAN